MRTTCLIFLTVLAGGQLLAQDPALAMSPDAPMQQLAAPEPLPPPEIPTLTPPPRPAGSEQIIDLRQPDFAELEQPENAVEPSWLNDLIDDHRLIPRAVSGGSEFLARGGTDGMGITSLTSKSDFAWGNGPLWLAPAFRWSFLNGPVSPDVPPQVFDFGLEVNFARQITPEWGLHLNITPLFATDLDNDSSDAFRLASGALVTWQWQPDVQLVAGLAYLDRPDLPFLPVGGVRWTPRDDIELDFTVPRPRLAYRFADDKGEGENWIYIAGDVGGGSWAIERELNRLDRMGYFDLRLLAGLEFRTVDGVRSMLEIGYVFARRLDFDRFGGDQDLDPTFVLRWGAAY